MKFTKILVVNNTNKAKAISAELLELNFKNKLEETENKIKQEETGRNRKTGIKKHRQPEETERN